MTHEGSAGPGLAKVDVAGMLKLMVECKNPSPCRYCASASARVLREVERLHSALRSATAPQDGWQPIETAPKDGTMVLVYDEGVMMVSSYVEFEGVEGWWDATIIAPPPTHWMPLPAAPQVAQP